MYVYDKPCTLFDSNHFEWFFKCIMRNSLPIENVKVKFFFVYHRVNSCITPATWRDCFHFVAYRQFRSSAVFGQSVLFQLLFFVCLYESICICTYFISKTKAKNVLKCLQMGRTNNLFFEISNWDNHLAILFLFLGKWTFAITLTFSLNLAKENFVLSAELIVVETK